MHYRHGHTVVGLYLLQQGFCGKAPGTFIALDEKYTVYDTPSSVFTFNEVYRGYGEVYSGAGGLAAGGGGAGFPGCSGAELSGIGDGSTLDTLGGGN